SLGTEVRRDVDRSVGNAQELRVGRNFHEEDMACAATRNAQTVCFMEQHAHENVSVNITFHNRVDSSLVRESNGRLCGCRFAIDCGNASRVWIPAVLLSKRSDLACIADQARFDESDGPRLLQRIKYKSLSSAYNGEADRTFILGAFDQVLHTHCANHCHTSQTKTH